MYRVGRQKSSQMGTRHSTLLKYSRKWGLDHRTERKVVDPALCGTISRRTTFVVFRFRRVSLDHAQALHGRSVRCLGGIGRPSHPEVVRGDTQAWNTYQDTVYSKLRPGEALHASRPDLWKAAARQLQKIEAERKKPVKKLKVSTRWQNKHVPGISDVQVGSPRPSAWLLRHGRAGGARCAGAA